MFKTCWNNRPKKKNLNVSSQNKGQILQFGCPSSPKKYLQKVKCLLTLMYLFILRSTYLNLCCVCYSRICWWGLLAYFKLKRESDSVYLVPCSTPRVCAWHLAMNIDTFTINKPCKKWQTRAIKAVSKPQEVNCTHIHYRIFFCTPHINYHKSDKKVTSLILSWSYFTKIN